MKKAILIIITLIISVALIIFIKSKIESKYNYKIEEVSEYKYFIYMENENFGVIDKDGKKIVDAKYTDVIIPNPRKSFICLL